MPKIRCRICGWIVKHWRSVKRWLSVFAYLVVGLVVATAFHHPFQIIGQGIAAYFSSNPWVMLCLGVLLGIGVAIVLAHLGAAPRVRMRQLCIWLRYPPSWLLVILAVPGLILIQRYVLNVDYFSGLSAGEIFWSLITCWGFLVGILVAIGYRLLREWLTEKKSDNTISSPPVQEEIASDGDERLSSEKIIDWIMEEKPIETNTLDFFDAEVYASRIVEKIRVGAFQNCALVGGYGTGKSSVLNLVEKKLLDKGFKLESKAKCRKICVCRVDGWGCLRAKVPEAILKQAVHELQDSIDCLAVSRLPIRYQQALERLPSPGPIMSALISEPTDAAKELEKLNTILKTAGIHLVIMVEDIDRNGKKGEEAMGVEVPALLDRLKECDAITVIVTLGLENPNAEVLVRVCEHREDLVCRTDAMVEVIRDFRDYCLTKYPKDQPKDKKDLDPVKRNDRDKRFMEASETMLEFITKHKDGNIQSERRSVVHGLAKEIFSTRNLKSVLRRTYQIWERLHGEIDFDELLVMNALRFGEPVMFSFIQINRDLFQRLHYTKEKSEKEEVRKQIYARWNRFEGIGDSTGKLSDSELGFSKEAFYDCMRFIFPLIQEEMDRFDPYPQSIALSHVNDYWERYHLEEIPENQFRDQTVYQAIEKWREDSSAKVINNRTLAENFVEDRQCRLIMEDVFTSTHFGLFNKDEVEDIRTSLAKGLSDHPEKEAIQKKLMTFASEVLFYIVKQYGKRTPLRELRLGRFWEIIKDFSGNPEFDEWCLNKFQELLPRSLNYAGQIFGHFAFALNDKAFLDEYAHIILETFGDNPCALLDALPDTYAGLNSECSFSCFISYHLTLYHGYKSPGFTQDQFGQFTDVMAKAARKNPEVMIPEIARFMVDYDHNKEEFKLGDPKLFDRFSDSHRKEILDLFASDEISLEGVNSEVIRIVGLARELARNIKDGKIDLNDTCFEIVF